MLLLELPLELLFMVAHCLIDLDDGQKLPSDPADTKLYLANLKSLRQVNRTFFSYVDPIFWQKTLSAHVKASERVLRPLIANNNLARLKFFLNCGADIECPLESSVGGEEVTSPQPLIMACCLDNVPMARLLLENGALIEYPLSFSPMHAARSAEMVQLLLDFHADPEIENCIGERPLHRYVDRKNTAAMRAILQRGADLNPTSVIYPWTPLHRAAQSGSADAVTILLEFGADVTARDKELNTPLHFAAKEGAIEVARLLLEGWPEGVRAQDAKSDTPLHRATIEGRTEMMRFLLERWPEGIWTKKVDGDTLFHLAAGSGETEAVRFLLERWPEGIREKNEILDTPLHKAALEGKIGVLRLLVERWPEGIRDKNKNLDTPLHRAAGMGRKLRGDTGKAETLQFLAESWPEGMRDKNKNLDTPLHLADNIGDHEAVMFLMETEIVIEMRRNTRDFVSILSHIFPMTWPPRDETSRD
jgi:ankyrin repeat protein